MEKNAIFLFKTKEKYLHSIKTTQDSKIALFCFKLVSNNEEKIEKLTQK